MVDVMRFHIVRMGERLRRSGESLPGGGISLVGAMRLADRCWSGGGLDGGVSARLLNGVLFSGKSVFTVGDVTCGADMRRVDGVEIARTGSMRPMGALSRLSRLDSFRRCDDSCLLLLPPPSGFGDTERTVVEIGLTIGWSGLGPRVFSMLFGLRSPVTGGPRAVVLLLRDRTSSTCSVELVRCTDRSGDGCCCCCCVCCVSCF
jgi:hypothetical protein